ncbi:MAG: hypothetical protein AAFS10_08980, partial [Myxococcota bacterium]
MLYYVDKRFDAAQPWYTRACDHGHHSGCLGLADGLDKEKDNWDAARKLLKQICREGNGYGCWVYVQRAQERGRPLKPAIRDTYIKRACKAGHTPACEAK